MLKAPALQLNLNKNKTVEILIRCETQAEAEKLFDVLNKQAKLGEIELILDTVVNK